MNFLNVVSTIAFLAGLLLFTDAVCPVPKTCQHNYGKRLIPTIQSQATYLSQSIVTMQGFDPIPCCLACYKQPGCDYYFLDFISGNCSLFSLPNTESFRMNLALGKYYKPSVYINSCIGYRNTYLFSDN